MKLTKNISQIAILGLFFSSYSAFASGSHCGPLILGKSSPVSTQVHIKKLLNEAPRDQAQLIKEKFKRGIGKSDPLVMAFHGFSFPRMRDIILKGFIPFVNHGTAENRKGLYLAGVLEMIPKEVIVQSEKHGSFEEAVWESQMYAQVNAYEWSRVIPVYEKIFPGQKIDSSILNDLYCYMDLGADLSSKTRDRLNKKGLDESGLDRITKNIKPKFSDTIGFVVSIDANLLNEFQVEDVHPDAGIFVEPIDKMPGLPLRLIRGIEAVSEDGREVWTDLN